MPQQTAHDYSLDLLEGGALPLSRYAGQPVLLVNTASKCGFTPQYEELQAVWSHYRGRGLVVIGTPCNDFGRQEPGSAEEIQAFCARNYGVSFPMAAKLHVSGPEAHPLYRWLAQQGGVLSKPRWNFYKYLIGRDGRLQTWFTSVTKPMNHRVRTAIDRAILSE
ncbi:glutathione peroxidase [Lichenicoccus roseus]|nr:glutathione peroxidase [Lichenicoccus roseus]